MRFTIRSDRATLALSAIIIVTAGASAHARGQRAVAPTPTPSVRVLVVPPPNGAGWHNTDVTIMFECVGVVECPENMVMTTEGAGQRIVRSAVDASGRTAQVEAVVNIDKSAGIVKIASPATASWAFDEGVRTLWVVQRPAHGYPYI